MIVQPSKLIRKEYDRDDKEYELHFEGISDDVEVSKDSFDQMTEGSEYELQRAKHSKFMLLVSDIQSGQVYFER